MLQFFLNPLMLLGLAGVALPVVAHLLSRRRYDVVNWGAMQFLDPSRKTRRKMKLEELLLLLVRIGAICLIAIAAARPWIGSGFLMGYNSAGSRDVVLVIDGSNSMGRGDGLMSLHQKAIRRAQDFLQTLQPGDTVAVIDARDRPIRVVESPLQDLSLVSRELDAIPPPAGAADLRHACEDAVGILGRCSNGSREIVVLTDRQRASWSVAKDTAWKRFDDVLNFPSVRPSLWVVDLSAGLAAISQNISIGRVDVSRDLTVPGFPVSLQVPVRNAGKTTVDVPLQILMNGQRVANLDATVSVPAESETTFSRSIRFSMEGTNLVTVKCDLPDDSVMADNSGHAAVRVATAIPVLLVEGSNSLDKTDWNTFFAQLALTAPGNKAPWILTKTVRVRDLTPDHLHNVAAAIFPDVTELPDGMASALHAFASSGKGVFIALGPKSSPESFQNLYGKMIRQLQLKRIRSADPDAVTPTTIAPYSLEAAWLNRFRERDGATFLTAAFERWWLLEATTESPETDDQVRETEPLSTERSENLQQHAVTKSNVAQPIPIAVAQLTSSDPLLLQIQCGRGSVLLMTSNIDAAWNGLPTRPDYVPFLHEALFQMASSRTRRNVGFGEQLTTVIPQTTDETDVNKLRFAGPFDFTTQAVTKEDDREYLVQLPGTRLPGIYELRHDQDTAAKPIDSFVVNYDHAEDNPAELVADDHARLIVNNRMTFVDSMESLRKQMYGDESRSELWGFLLFVFLGMLMLEVWMTRRLVQRGHADTLRQEQATAAIP
ncbi:MAG: VWA domain-containing protein [Fuerstiella sp.]|nr:VWA domain-containing protein [Fuerstiella sp.]MCP4859076.1 VWA domain-containing protein [Fuerstiella sp.]